MGGGSLEPRSRDYWGGPGSLWLSPAPPPAPRPSPFPALEHVALTIYGAADAAVREPGSPGAAATKAREAGRGRQRPPGPVCAASYLRPSLPTPEWRGRKEVLGNQALSSRSGAFTCAQVYAGEGNLINAPLKAISTPPRLCRARSSGVPQGWRRTQGPSPASSLLVPDCSGAGVGRVNLRGGMSNRYSSVVSPQGPPGRMESRPGGEGLQPHPRGFHGKRKGGVISSSPPPV